MLVHKQWDLEMGGREEGGRERGEIERERGGGERETQ